MSDKFTAVWVSHSSIRDFINCPRAYFLKNIYRDPNTRKKVKLMTPPLALGQVVHEVLESLSILPRDKRFEVSLVQKLEDLWPNVSGDKGGFSDKDVEFRYKKRAQEMLFRAQENPGPLNRLAVKIKEDLPHYWLSETDQIILCGKLDWLEYLPETDSVHIIDFKTGKGSEEENSLQLPIYHLLVHHCQKRKVEKASYWYLERENEPDEKALPDLTEAHNKVLDIARKVKLARQLEKFSCPKGDGCMFCEPMERIVKGEGKLVGVDQYGTQTYVLPNKTNSIDEAESIIL